MVGVWFLLDCCGWTTTSSRCATSLLVSVVSLLCILSLSFRIGVQFSLLSDTMIDKSIALHSSSHVTVGAVETNPLWNSFKVSLITFCYILCDGHPQLCFCSLPWLVKCNKHTWILILFIAGINCRLTVVFLAFDVFFVIFCIGMAFVVFLALFCCIPILAIAYAVASTEGASEDIIRSLPKYRYRPASVLSTFNNLGMEEVLGARSGLGNNGSSGELFLHSEDSVSVHIFGTPSSHVLMLIFLDYALQKSYGCLRSNRRGSCIWWKRVLSFAIF